MAEVLILPISKAVLPSGVTTTVMSSPLKLNASSPSSSRKSSQVKLKPFKAMDSLGLNLKLLVIYSQMGSLTSTHNCNTGSLLRCTHNYLAFRSLNIIYALLDEMTDFGYPQDMEARILKEFIKTDAYRMEVTQRPPMAVTSSLLKERRDTVQ
ncbi:hypothetical protein Bca52824_060666 [Brassica carinata]|uniref:Uncharacterized protein n=1 Tax=Brassica carinata TaxID=52824 RepID=A0A8X7QXY6_BRACI|nr:hypothetical protein Bca52824_060666 [Brassica carinata]